MKKISLILAALTAVTIFAPGARAAQAFSKNIVGYTKVQLDAGMNLLGQQFVNVGDDAALNIQKIITSANLPGFDSSTPPIAQSEIWIYDGSYNNYYYISAANAIAWSAPEMGGTWVDYTYQPADEVIDASQGVWIKTEIASEIIFSGQVYSETNATVSVISGLNLISNPFPVVWDIQNMSSPDLIGFDSSTPPIAQSELWVYNNGSYDCYYFISEANAIAWSSPGMAGTWVDYTYTPANVTINPSKGFWLNTISPATIKFTRPN